MKSLLTLSLLAGMVAFPNALAAPVGAAGMRVAGEASTTTPQAAPRWRAPAAASSRVTRQSYRELPIARLLELERRNQGGQAKAMHVGIARDASREALQPRLPGLAWQSSRDGGHVASLQVRSPDAMAVRVGLRFAALDPRAELRFGGSLDAGVVAVLGGQEVMRLRDAQGLFWTPATDGQWQTIEIYLPRGAATAGVSVQAPALSHLLADSRSDFRILKNVGSSGTCNVNVACRAQELGQGYVNAKNAVAHMVYVKGGSSFVCTGTLLADTVAATQVPYFYSATHCIESQAVASTLNTYWGREADTCAGSGPTGTLLAGGATLLYADQGTDALLLRLNNAAPAGAFFSGWDSNTLAGGSSLIGIHHPSGDLKKVSSGQQVTQDAEQITVGWLSGTTEGGSSGSAIFTAGATGYALRGGLYGGSASCANTGSLASAGNRDYYSRFDVAFAAIRQYLAPVDSTPVRVNGSQPLVPPPTGQPIAANARISTGTPPARPRRTEDARTRRAE